MYSTRHYYYRSWNYHPLNNTQTSFEEKYSPPPILSRTPRICLARHDVVVPDGGSQSMYKMIYVSSTFSKEIYL